MNHPIRCELQRKPTDLSPEEWKLYAFVEGFGEHAPSIQEWFRERPVRRDGTRVVIYGAKGTGRSSVANYIVHEFVKAANLTFSDISFLPVPVNDRHPIEPVRQALALLRRELKDRNKFKPGAELEGRVYKSILLNEPQGTPELFADIFGDILGMIRNVDKAPCPLPVFVFDELREYDQLANIASSLSEWSLVICITAEESVLTRWEEKCRSGALRPYTVRLSPLTPQHAVQFISQRWEVLERDDRHVFIDEGLVRALRSRPFPFRAIVDLLSEMFDRAEKQHTKVDHALAQGVLVDRLSYGEWRADPE